MATMTRDQIVAKLEGTGLPFAPIGRPEDMFDDPQLANGGLEDVTLDNGKETRLPTIPLEMGGKRPGAPVTLPQPGADGRAILQMLGYPADRIADLIGQGAVETA
jgi:crotonobetainyl-CoA:carnitine CoA-transferase CaiB-like acyl-CoA transferase